ncbi:MAG: hypothetical protein WCR20_13860 [Verrucomicrobiota bacterium]
MNGLWRLAVVVALSIYGAAAQQSEVTAKDDAAQKQAPKSDTGAGGVVGKQLSPEDTLNQLLTAYIDRDVDTIMKLMPPALQNNPERLERVRSAVATATTDTRHVIRISELKLQKTELRKEDLVATLIAKVQTTPGFSGAPAARGEIREYRWYLVQFKCTGPWYFNAGGF